MQTPRIVFSDHPEWQLQERQLSRSIVLETLRHPNSVVEGYGGRSIAQRVIRRGRIDWLYRVVYVRERDALIVATVYRTTKVAKYLRR